MLRFTRHSALSHSLPHTLPLPLSPSSPSVRLLLHWRPVLAQTWSHDSPCAVASIWCVRISCPRRRQYVNTNAYAHKRTQTHAHTHTRMYVHVHVHVFVHVRVHVHLHVHEDTHTHTHTHTHSAVLTGFPRSTNFDKELESAQGRNTCGTYAGQRVVVSA